MPLTFAAMYNLTKKQFRKVDLRLYRRVVLLIVLMEHQIAIKKLFIF